MCSIRKPTLETDMENNASRIFRRILITAALFGVSACYANSNAQQETNTKMQDAQLRSDLIAKSVRLISISISKSIEELVFVTDWSGIQGKIKNEDITKLEKLEEMLTQASLAELKAETANDVSTRCDVVQLKVAVSGILKALRDLQICSAETCALEKLRKPRSLLYTWLTTLRDTLKTCETP